MAFLTHQCPHCLTAHIALRVTAPGLYFQSMGGGVHLDCPKCGKPSCAVLGIYQGGPAADVNRWQNDIDIGEVYRVLEMWPEAAGPIIPEALPPDMERIYLQAERNFPIEGNEEAAGTMYRKALDVGLKKIDSTAKGTLAQRIKRLTDAGKLTADIADWADQIRELGNEAAHEDEPPTRDELTTLRNFSEMALRYLFSMPALVAARRQATAETEPAKQ